MKTSRRGIELIKKWEGLRLKSYRDGAGIWTVGYGTTSAAGFGTITKDTVISKERADEMLVSGLVQYEMAVQKALTRSPNQNQFDAFVSLCYNIGPGNFKASSAVKYFNAGYANKAAGAFGLWCKISNPLTGKKEFSQGLANRRKDEIELFLAPTLAKDGVSAYPVPDTQKPEKPAVEPPRRSLWAWIKALFSRG